MEVQPPQNRCNATRRQHIPTLEEIHLFFVVEAPILQKQNLYFWPASLKSLAIEKILFRRANAISNNLQYFSDMKMIQANLV